MSKDDCFHFKVEVALESCVSFVEQKIHTQKTVGTECHQNKHQKNLN